jgi:hypothetical protein
MPARTRLRQQQLREALEAVTARPGITAYTVGTHVSVPGMLRPPEGVLAVSAPLTLVLSLLAGLEREGRVRAEPDPKGNRWYPAGES